MLNVLQFLSGKKTYIVSALALGVIGLWLFGVIDQEAAEKMLATLGVSGIITLRAAVTKSGSTQP
ncbi:MAG: hypothetical protein H8K07_01595 [Nitrospira sp.]|nr:hypothetical protein [Nitrospira sp.]